MKNKEYKTLLFRLISVFVGPLIAKLMYDYCEVDELVKIKITYLQWLGIITLVNILKTKMPEIHNENDN